jgi:hypothetical protein
MASLSASGCANSAHARSWAWLGLQKWSFVWRYNNQPRHLTLEWGPLRGFLLPVQWHAEGPEELGREGTAPIIISPKVVSAHRDQGRERPELQGGMEESDSPGTSPNSRLA